MTTILDEDWYDEQMRKEEEIHIAQMEVVRQIRAARKDVREEQKKRRDLELKRRRRQKQARYDDPILY